MQAIFRLSVLRRPEVTSVLVSFSSVTQLLTRPASPRSAPIFRFFGAQPQSDDEDSSGGVSTGFDSADFDISSTSANSTVSEPSWDQTYREKVDKALFGKEKKDVKGNRDGEHANRAKSLAKALLQAALQRPDDEEEEEEAVRIDGMVVKEEDQMSLSVGIVGAPNAGKSALTNYMVGNKVSAVSRKTNTTTHEVLGVVTKGNTQICFFDTPGLMLKRGGYPYRTDVTVRVESAWSSIELYDLLIVLFDVHRHLTACDARVTRLIKHLGENVHPKQKRVLCMNKVDLVEVKKDLLKVAKEFGNLPGYERFFMISGLKGSGVEDLTHYLMEQAVKRPWDEDPTSLNEEFLKSLSLEVVREKLLHHVHQEIPYALEHRLVDWKELRDGSLRIEQHFLARKQSHRKIVVGKSGSKIGKIGMEATEELRSMLKRHVHLILMVRMA
ncbi:GTP-binding protein ERG [Nymphaea colorata]|nr:GTP-binding protein ERG [Nymphaea colorata]